jgi:hypothetical protein
MGPLYCRRPCRGPTKDYVRCIEVNAKVTKVKFPVVKAVWQICASGSRGNHSWATLLCQVTVTWLHYYCNTFLQWLIISLTDAAKTGTVVGLFGYPRKASIHCKDKLPKFRNKYSQKRKIGVSVPISTFMRLWAIYMFLWFGGLPILEEEIYRPILGLCKSLTYTWMLKLGLRPRYSQKRNT